MVSGGAWRAVLDHGFGLLAFGGAGDRVGSAALELPPY
jgi:hypothetical protein